MNVTWKGENKWNQVALNLIYTRPPESEDLEHPLKTTIVKKFQCYIDIMQTPSLYHDFHVSCKVRNTCLQIPKK